MIFSSSALQNIRYGKPGASDDEVKAAAGAAFAHEFISALDAESERMVQAALESAMRDRTTLVIAHRLATVQKADLIVVLDHGQLVEQGTHAELVARGGVYAGLAALQFNA